MKKRTEFPLVELILIVILLFVLAIFALPKVMDVGAEARIKALNATALNIASVNRLLYSRALINGVQRNELQSTDILGTKDAGAYLVYGELKASEDDLSQYIDGTLFEYSTTEKQGEIRLYLTYYQNEFCSITYRQAQQVTSVDGQTSIQNASTQIKSTDC